MSQPQQLETDPNFPSGRWVGFFTQKPLFPGQQGMELDLIFAQARMTGDGRDKVGKFTIDGHYDISSGKCYWHKKYQGAHDVFYSGFNEGKGIWGTWEFPGLKQYGSHCSGGFHIWPEHMGDPTMDHLVEEADIPITVYADELTGTQAHWLIPKKRLLLPSLSVGNRYNKFES